VNVWAGEGAPRDRSDVAGLIEWELVVPDASARADMEQRLAAGAYGFWREVDTIRASDDDGNVVVVHTPDASA
jgi:catechol-2,3-dioxygenase